MSEFKKLQTKVKEQFKKITDSSSYLYTLDTEKNELWNIYLDNFPEGTNEIYRERREQDCSACRHFVNSIGNVVGIIDNKVVSIWDFDMDDAVYGPSMKALSSYTKTKAINDIYLSRFNDVGILCNRENNDGKIVTWNHFHVDLPKKYVNNNEDVNVQKKCTVRDIRAVFKRSLEEISPESVATVIELIAQNSLYKGAEWKGTLTEFTKLQTEYNKLSDEHKVLYLWEKSNTVGPAIGKIKNHSMGTLLMNITEGIDLDTAVKKYEQIVAPTNYKRPKPIFTKAMLEKAKKKVEELGYEDSLGRRHAILEDISVNNILFANRNITSRLQGNDVFAEMETEVPIDPKAFDRVEEVAIEDFINNILPTTKNIELFLESAHSKNMTSLIAPSNAAGKTMFKWANNFCWAYTGNITDSDIKRNVKTAGGKVDGILRFSIQWNDEAIHNRCDYDAHCHEPNGNHIHFSNKRNHNTTGVLDIDITSTRKGVPAVENITWSNKSRMERGVYKFAVHNFSNNGGSSGFRAEIEFNGKKFNFDYQKSMRQGEMIQVANVIFDGENFTVEEKLPSSMSSKDVWNLKTNNFVPVTVMMHSPNYWDEQKGIGNKHYFFMLKDCINEETPNGFFNEFLNNELTEHRKVFEAIGAKMAVAKVDNQLSGIGFSSTQRNEVVLRVEGSTKRLIKIKF